MFPHKVYTAEHLPHLNDVNSIPTKPKLQQSCVIKKHDLIFDKQSILCGLKRSSRHSRQKGMSQRVRQNNSNNNMNRVEENEQKKGSKDRFLPPQVRDKVINMRLFLNHIEMRELSIRKFNNGHGDISSHYIHHEIKTQRKPNPPVMVEKIIDKRLLELKLRSLSHTPASNQFFISDSDRNRSPEPLVQERSAFFTQINKYVKLHDTFDLSKLMWKAKKNHVIQSSDLLRQDIS